MKKMALLASLAFLFFASCADAQPPVKKTKEPIRIAFYNVENLFDTKDDPNVKDEEFLPDGKNKWTEERYKTKLDNLAKVILAIGDGKGPAILGMSEVENKGVLEDLTQKTALKEQQYGIVHYDSPDGRGIDVAMIYKKAKFQVLDSKSLRMPQPSDSMLPTRDVLLVKGIVGGRDTLFIMVNHWPSRRNGTTESQQRRLIAANFIKHIEDSLQKENPNVQVLAMGDLNDEPTDESLRGITHAADQARRDGFVNMMWSLKKSGDGTHYYKGEKSMFDQILVSPSLLDKRGYYTEESRVRIFRPDWLMGEVYKGDPPSPLRTFAGSRYLGGYSDHLAVYIDLVFSK
jgi:predicted extracellular nuclease